MSAIYYGISENAQYRCVVARQQDQSQLYWQASNTSLPESIRQSRNLIYALPHHTIWRKVLFFPANTAPTLVYAQIIRFLKQQLPLPLEEVCFDYHIQQVEQRQRVTLFVLRQQVFRAKSIPPKPFLIASGTAISAPITICLPYPCSQSRPTATHFSSSF